jgi:hypothetical protein
MRSTLYGRLLAAALLLAAMAATASAQARQTVVYTNVVGGRPVPEIVAVVRVATPAAPVPPSITTTPVLPRNWRPPLGPTSYVPPPRAAAAPLPAPAPQPWFVNGVHVGPSPSGLWTSTVVGRPVVDVNIVGTPRPR